MYGTHPNPIFAPKVPCWRGLIALAALALLTAPVAAQPDKPPEVKPALDTFQAGGKPIRVERFEPGVAGKYPAIVLLHGVDGLGEQGERYRQQARLYVQKGYVVLLLSYFDRSNLTPPQWKAVAEAIRHYFHPAAARKPEEARALEKHFADWTDTAAEAVRYAGRLANVNPARIGLAGLSLGGAVALRTAARNEVKIAAVVELFGGLPKELREAIQAMPPTLMIHGDLDERVPPWEAYALEDVFLSRKLPGEFKMYPRVGHAFETASWNDRLDAHQRVEAFLKKHLQDNAVARPGR